MSVSRSECAAETDYLGSYRTEHPTHEEDSPVFSLPAAVSRSPLLEGVCRDPEFTDRVEGETLECTSRGSSPALVIGDRTLETPAQEEPVLGVVVCRHW